MKLIPKIGDMIGFRDRYGETHMGKVVEELKDESGEIIYKVLIPSYELISPQDVDAIFRDVPIIGIDD